MKEEFPHTSVCPVTGLPVARDPGWSYEAGDGTYALDIRFIGDQILYIRSKGYSRKDHQTQGTRLRMALEEKRVPRDKKAVLVFDWSGVTGASLAARSVFLEGLAQDERIKGVVFLSTAFMVRLSIKLGTRLYRFPFPFAFAGDEAAALDLAGKINDDTVTDALKTQGSELNGAESPGREGDAGEKAIARYKDELLAFMGRLNWDKRGIQTPDLPESHPFKEVFYALLLIKSDLDAVFEERDVLEAELKTHQENLEQMIRRRTRELEEEMEQKRYARRINTTLFDISTAVTMTANLNELYPLIHQYLERIIRLPNFMIGIHDAKTGSLTIPYCVDEHQTEAGIMPDNSEGFSLSSEVVAQQRPLLLVKEQLVEEGYRFRFHQVPEYWLGVPLVSQERVMGILVAKSYRREDALTHKDLELLVSVSNQVAVAIERRQALDNVSQREKKYRKLIQTTSAGYLLVDRANRIAEANPTLCTMIGYDAAEILGKSPVEFVQESDREFYLSQSLLLSQDRERHYEVTLVGKTGYHIRVKVDASSLFDEAGGYQGAFAFVSDVSDRYLAQKALMEAKEKAEDASRAKSEFLANMSHEIRTPINGVLGMAEILLGTGLSPSRVRYVKTIENEAAALLNIVNAILDFSKIEAGRMELESIRFDLGKIFDDLANVMAVRAGKKGLEFVIRLDPAAPRRLKGDPGRLRQILLNLADNAVKFTEQGRVSVHGSLVKQTDDWAELRFEVQDTGIGIPPAQQGHIFQSFSQADGSTTRKYGGTGLGTTIAKQLVELMGGRIGFDSAPGKGTVFWVAAGFERQQETTCDDAESLDFSGLTFLVRDENPAHCRSLCAYIEDLGAAVRLARDPDEAVQILAQSGRDICLVITDHCPGASCGFEFTRKIRQMAGIPRVPIILMTASGQQGDGESCRRLNIAGYLPKPLVLDDLKSAVTQILQNPDRGLVTAHSLAEQRNAGRRILLVEDYPTNQIVAIKHLKHAGFQVFLAKNGEEAVARYRTGSFDLVLMDIQMPKLDGYGATRQIREIEAGLSGIGRVPIIAMTAHAMDGYREKCIAGGMDDYITKPMRREALIRMVERWLGRGSECTALPQENAASAGAGTMELPPMDLSGALREFDGDVDFFKEIISEFITHVRTQIALIQKGLADGKPEVLEKEGHSIKGGAANLLARDLSQAAYALECAGRAKDLSDGQALLDALTLAFERFCDQAGTIGA